MFEVASSSHAKIAAIAAPGIEGEGIAPYSNLDEFLQERGATPVALVLGQQARSTENFARLRRQSDLAFVPLYVDDGAGDDWRAATDGVWPGALKAVQQADDYGERLRQYLGERTPENQDERLLTYFRLRPDGRLVPFVDQHSDDLYRYPLLEAFSDDGAVADWLATLRRRGWLERTEVVDRIRRCRRCDSGHLNYVDICPECSSVDIESRESLHCFVCGHVDRRDAFTREGALVCPNCYSRLRHIGVDYDRPLETHGCNQCMATFSEARVVARCLACGQEDDPGDLNAVTIGRYRVNPQTRLLAATGLTGDWTSSIRELRLMPTALFAKILDWQIDVARRYDSHFFSLVGLNLGDLNRLVDNIGEGRALQLLDGFSERLQEMLRSSDLIGRTLDNQLWLLLPGTPADNLPVVVDRLRRLEELAEPEAELSLTVTAATVPDDLESGDDAQLLMARLGEGSP